MAVNKIVIAELSKNVSEQFPEMNFFELLLFGLSNEFYNIYFDMEASWQK